MIIVRVHLFYLLRIINEIVGTYFISLGLATVFESQSAEELIRILEGYEEDLEEFVTDNELEEQEESGDSEFHWTETETTPIVQPFNDFHAGFSPEINLSTDSNELDFFEYFVDDGLVAEIVRCTNRYYQFYVRRVDIREHSRTHAWRDVDAKDIYLCLAVTMLFTRNKRISIEEHWSTDPLLSSPIFHNTMNRNKYCLILAMMHFTDVFSVSTGLPRLHKLQFVINHARDKFKNGLTPHHKLCIDESIVPFKGRLVLKQYLPKKRNRFGIKLFVLCDVKTGYILDFVVYCGTETDIEQIPDLGVSGSVVVALLKEYFNTNRQLFVDNWYSSPKLFRYLKDNGTYACGTVKKNRKGMPKFKKLSKGEVDAHYSPPLMTLKWQDKKAVTMISTMHDAKLLPSNKEDRATGLPKLKPECVIDYTNNMGVVDTADMMMSTLSCIRKTRRWYLKLALRIIDMSMLNAFYTYKVINNCPRKPFCEFQLAVIRQIVSKNKIHDYEPVPSTSRGVQNDPCRFLPNDVLKHFPVTIPNKKRQRCRVCALKNKPKYTRYMCKPCNTYLCLENCITEFHRKPSGGRM